MKYLVLILALLTIGCATDEDIFHKDGINERIFTADFQSCENLAEVSGFPRNNSAGYAWERRKFIGQCMYSKGYDHVRR